MDAFRRNRRRPRGPTPPGPLRITFLRRLRAGLGICRRLHFPPFAFPSPRKKSKKRLDAMRSAMYHLYIDDAGMARDEP